MSTDQIQGSAKGDELSSEQEKLEQCKFEEAAMTRSFHALPGALQCHPGVKAVYMHALRAITPARDIAAANVRPNRSDADTRTPDQKPTLRSSLTQAQSIIEELLQTAKDDIGPSLVEQMGIFLELSDEALQSSASAPAAQRQAEPVAVLKTPEGVIDLRAIAEQAGISMGLWEMAAGSLAFSEGCHGITREHLERFASLYGFACWNAALEANPPNMQGFVGHAIDSLFQAPAAKAEPAPDLTPEELADKCEAWLHAGGASNIVDAYEAGYRDCEAAHAGRKPARAPDYPGEVVDPEDMGRLGKLFEGKTVESVLSTLDMPAVERGDKQ